MKRRTWDRWLLAAGLTGVALSTTPAAAEYLAIPFQCKLERGRIVLSPSIERTYELIGSRKQQPFLFCAARDETRCRLRMLHSFEMMCGGSRVQWVDVAAAVTRLSGREAWVESARLSVVLGQPEKPASTDCIDTPWPSASGAISSAPGRPCANRGRERTGPRVVSMPAGFAPLSELGARLSMQPARVPAAAGVGMAVAGATAAASPSSASPTVQVAANASTPNSTSASYQDSVSDAGPSAIARYAIIGPDSDTPLVQNAVAPPPPTNSQAPAQQQPAEIRQSADLPPVVTPPEELKPFEQVIVRQVPAGPDAGERQPAREDKPVAHDHVQVAEAAERSRASAVRDVTIHLHDKGAAITAAVSQLVGLTGASAPLFYIALLTVSLGAVGLVVRRSARQARQSGQFRRLYGVGDLTVTRRSNLLSLEDPDERILFDLRRTADQLRINAEAVLDELHSAPPLRGVLRQELDFIEQRLSELPRSGSQPVTAKQLRQRFQAGIRELHRVIKIAEGAAASFSSSALRPKVPLNKDEAYELLGVNESVSESTLKKVVDALRMSWHPDYASGEDDRARREERTKQINVAWDLITGRRAAS